VYQQDDEIHIEDKEWSCDKELCKISFSIENTTETHKRIQVNINAFMSGRDRFQGKITGTDQFEIGLGAKEKMKIERTFEAISRTKIINVSARELIPKSET